MKSLTYAPPQVADSVVLMSASERPSAAPSPDRCRSCTRVDPRGRPGAPSRARDSSPPRASSWSRAAISASWPRPAAILELQLEAGDVAELGDRRRRGREHDRLLDLRERCVVARAATACADELARLALVPVACSLHERGARVLAATAEAEAGDRQHRLDARPSRRSSRYVATRSIDRRASAPASRPAAAAPGRSAGPDPRRAGSRSACCRTAARARAASSAIDDAARGSVRRTSTPTPRE